MRALTMWQAEFSPTEWLHESPVTALLTLIKVLDHEHLTLISNTPTCSNKLRHLAHWYSQGVAPRPITIESWGGHEVLKKDLEAIATVISVNELKAACFLTNDRDVKSIVYSMLRTKPDFVVEENNET